MSIKSRRSGRVRGASDVAGQKRMSNDLCWDFFVFIKFEWKGKALQKPPSTEHKYWQSCCRSRFNGHTESFISFAIDFYWFSFSFSRQPTETMLLALFRELYEVEREMLSATKRFTSDVTELSVDKRMLTLSSPLSVSCSLFRSLEKEMWLLTTAVQSPSS